MRTAAAWSAMKLREPGRGHSRSITIAPVLPNKPPFETDCWERAEEPPSLSFPAWCPLGNSPFPSLFIIVPSTINNLVASQGQGKVCLRLLVPIITFDAMTISYFLSGIFRGKSLMESCREKYKVSNNLIFFKRNSSKPHYTWHSWTVKEPVLFQNYIATCC